MRDPLMSQSTEEKPHIRHIATCSTTPTLAVICRQDPTGRGRHEHLRLSRFSVDWSMTSLKYLHVLPSTRSAQGRRLLLEVRPNAVALWAKSE